MSLLLLWISCPMPFNGATILIFLNIDAMSREQKRRSSRLSTKYKHHSNILQKTGWDGFVIMKNVGRMLNEKG